MNAEFLKLIPRKQKNRHTSNSAEPVCGIKCASAYFSIEFILWYYYIMQRGSHPLYPKGATLFPITLQGVTVSIVQQGGETSLYITQRGIPCFQIQKDRNPFLYNRKGGTLYNAKGGTLRAVPPWEIDRQYILL